MQLVNTEQAKGCALDKFSRQRGNDGRVNSVVDPEDGMKGDAW